MTDQRPTVLILFHYFGGEAGATGPTQSIISMAEAMASQFRFMVITEALPDDEPGRWTEFKGIARLPLRTTRFGVKGLRQAINCTPHDVLIASSFFDPRFTILPLLQRKLGAITRSPMMVGPNGEFNPGALRISRHKKAVYLETARLLRLLDGVSLQGTTPEEVQVIRAGLPFFRGDIHLLPIIRKLPPVPPHRVRDRNEPLRIVFLSRIDRMKNLHFAIEILRSAGIPVVFDIIGPVFPTGEEYWDFCQEKMTGLPPGAEIAYRGPVNPTEVIPLLAEYDLFFLPTLGENYGHAIVDSLIAGTPVLLSDQTPWRGLAERGAGWDLPLTDAGAFVEALRYVEALDDSGRLVMRAAARSYAEVELRPDEAVEQANSCFERLIEAGARPGSD